MVYFILTTSLRKFQTILLLRITESPLIMTMKAINKDNAAKCTHCSVVQQIQCIAEQIEIRSSPEKIQKYSGFSHDQNLFLFLFTCKEESMKCCLEKNSNGTLAMHNKQMRQGASIYHVVRGGGGVHEMTMNDHEGEGRVSEMTTWLGGLKFFISDQKMVA